MSDEEQAEDTADNGDTGIVIGIRVADGGMIVECNAPKEGFKRTAVVAGDFTSYNCRRTVQRHCRAFIKEWLG